MRTGTPFTITRTDDCANVGDGSTASRWTSSAIPLPGANGQFSTGLGPELRPSTPRRSPRSRLAPRFGNTPRNNLWNPGDQQWDIAFFKNFTVTNSQKMQLRVEMFNFPNHPNLSGPNGGHHQPELGRERRQVRRPPRHSAGGAGHLLNLIG